MSVRPNVLLKNLRAQVKQSIARLRLVWDERMKMKAVKLKEQKAAEDQARAAVNQANKKRLKEERYIAKRTTKFATVGKQEMT